MDERLIEEVFKKEGIEKEIFCPKAFLISDRYHVPKMDLSEYCNKHNIKIRGCQLGCFK